MKGLSWFARLIGGITVLLTIVSVGQPATVLAAPAPPQDAKAILQAAMKKTASATVYQLDTDFSMKGMPPDLATMLGITSPDREVSLVHLATKIRNQDSSMLLKGAFLPAMGIDPATGLEIMEVSGKTYIHGPLPLLGATENKWYIADNWQGPQSIADSFMLAFGKGFDYNSFQKSGLTSIKPLGKEAMDGRQCDVYGADDKQAIARALQSAAMMSASGADLGTVDAAEVKFWICDDGYFHRMWVSVDGTTTDPPGQKVGIRVRVSFFDFNGNFTIVAPANAAKLQQPNVGATYGGPTATVFHGGNIRRAPTMQGQVLGHLHTHQSVALLARKRLMAAGITSARPRRPAGFTLRC